MQQTGLFGMPFRQHVEIDDIEGVLRRYRIPYRRRLFDPATTIWAWIGQIASQDRSCRHAVSRVVSYRAAQGQPVSARTGGYAQARKRLDARVVRDLAREVAIRLHTRSHRWPEFTQYPVVLVDTTGLSGPDTESNQAQFPQHGNQEPGLGFPAIKLVVSVCLDSGAILDIATSPIRGEGSHDTLLVRQVWDWLPPQCLVVGDRAFGSYWNFALVKQRGFEMVVRHRGQKYEGSTFVRHLKAHDKVISVPRPKMRPKWMTLEEYRNFLPSMELRVTAVHDPGDAPSRTGRIRLLSTETDGLLKRRHIEEIYRRRWDIEVDIRSFKIDLGADILRCKTAEMLHKELWMMVLTYNAVRSVMADAAEQAGVRPRQLSFRGALQAINAFGARLDSADRLMQEHLLNGMRAAIASHVVGDRPGRIEPRAVKRRPKQRRLLTVPREEARDRMWTHSEW